MSKKYAVIAGYGKMIVPVALLEKIAQQCYIGRTEWIENKDTLTEVRSIGEVNLIDCEEIETVKAQMALSGE